MAKLTAETYTDQEIVDLYRQGLAEGSAGQTRTIRGKTIVYPSAEVMLKVIKEFEGRVINASGVSRVVHSRHGRC